MSAKMLLVNVMVKHWTCN